MAYLVPDLISVAASFTMASVRRLRVPSWSFGPYLIGHQKPSLGESSGGSCLQTPGRKWWVIFA